MPAKKAKGKKKKEVKIEEGGELTIEQQAQMFKTTVQSLQMQLAERTEDASRALEVKKGLERRVQDVQRGYEEEKQGTFQITRDMTRQYKSMQDKLSDAINEQEQKILELEDMLKAADMEKKRIIKEKDAIIAIKDKEITDMKKKMEEMAQEFGDMLKQTLKKMTDKIELSAASLEGDDIVPIQRHLEEYNLAGHNQRLDLGN